jgi:predicted MPP superfamily phosphohydrolase
VSAAGRTGGALAAAALAGVGTLAYGALVERSAFTVRHETVPVLAPGARSLTVLHLSDIHMAPWQRAKQEWIRGLAVYEPDLVVDTGDNVGHERGIEGLEYALEPFRDIPGVYVNGSNDYIAPQPRNPARYFSARTRGTPSSASELDVASMESFLDGLGWLSLNNRARAMSIRGSRLEFVGVNDPHIGLDRLDLLPGALDELRDTVSWRGADDDDSDVITVGVAHAPYRRVLNALVTNGADLLFAGHTHGGQVRIPGVGAVVTNCDIPNDQASGLSLWRHARRTAHLNVSAGLGTSIYAPVRLACKPEAVVLTLTASDIGYP